MQGSIVYIYLFKRDETPLKNSLQKSANIMLHVTTSTANFLFNGAWVILSQQHCNTPFNKWS